MLYNRNGPGAPDESNSRRLCVFATPEVLLISCEIQINEKDKKIYSREMSGKMCNDGLLLYEAITPSSISCHVSIVALILRPISHSRLL